MSLTCQSGWTEKVKASGGCFERLLRDTASGTTGLQFATDDARVTMMFDGPELRELEGKSMVTTKPVTVLVDDDRWEPVVGMSMALTGGVEVTMDDERLERCLEDLEASGLGPDDDPLMPVSLRDVHYPPARCLVPLTELRDSFTIVEAMTGRWSSGDPVEHEGPHKSKGTYVEFVPTCRRCFLEWWQARDKEQTSEEQTDE